MLVLSRKAGQQIVVPECGLAVTVLAVEGSGARLGVSAPAEIAVYREEIWRKVRQEIGSLSREVTEQTFWEIFAAELSNVAYGVALRAKAADSWINLELNLWRVLARTVKLWAHELPRAANCTETPPVDVLNGFEHPPVAFPALAVGAAAES